MPRGTIETFKINRLSPSVAPWSLVGVNVRPASAPPGIVADERRQCVLPVARPARLKIFTCLLTLAISANLVDNWNGKGYREVPWFGQTAQSWYHLAMAVG
jgi:hypothetical protein